MPCDRNTPCDHHATPSPFRPGEALFVGAETGGGKSAVLYPRHLRGVSEAMWQEALGFAEQGISVLLFSLEDAGAGHLSRLMANCSRLDVPSLPQLDLSVVYGPATYSGVASAVREWEATRRPGVVMLDRTTAVVLDGTEPAGLLPELHVLDFATRHMTFIA